MGLGEVKFAADSPLEGKGFEPPVPQEAFSVVVALLYRAGGVTKRVFATHFVTITAPVAASPVVKLPAMPGMLRKSRAFVLRYYKFESISLQRRVCKLSVVGGKHANRTLASEVGHRGKGRLGLSDSVMQ